METKKIIVTGGAGFIGSWLVEELINRGHEVTNIDSLLGGQMRNVHPDCKFVKMDLREDRHYLGALMKGVDIIYHLAAYAAEGQSIFSPIAINAINIEPMNNLLVEAVNNDVEKFIFTSSIAVYGAQEPPFVEIMQRLPEDPYGCGKTYCENMLEVFAKGHGFKYAIVRPNNVYGPRQNIADSYRNVFGIWFNRIMRNKPPLIYGDGEQKRAFSYIADLAPTLAEVGFREKAEGEIINIGSGEETTVNQACKDILDVTDCTLESIHVPPRPLEVKYAWSDNSKARAIVDYQTRYSLKDGLTQMYEWAKEIGPQEPTYILPLEITKGAPDVWKERSM